MPLAALFIGGVLPAQLGSLIRKRAGYMKKIQPEVVSSKPQASSRSVEHQALDKDYGII